MLSSDVDVVVVAVAAVSISAVADHVLCDLGVFVHNILCVFFVHASGIEA